MVKDCSHVDVTDLMREWVELGDKERENPYTRFMAYWVAFNMLYERYKDGCSEFAAIWKCFNFNKANFEQYNPFLKGEADIYTSDAAAHLYKSGDDDPEKERARIKRQNRRSLLYAVYRVRCNFFHGNKRLGDEVDRAFVAYGATIIRNYLGTFGFIPEASSESLLPDSVSDC